MQNSYQLMVLAAALEKQAGQKGEPGVWDHISNWIYRNPEWASSIAGGLVGGGIGAATGKPGTGFSRFLIGALLGGGAGYGAGYLGRNKLQSWLNPQRYAKARDIESKEKTWLTEALSNGTVDPKNPEVIRLAKHHGIDISKIAPGETQPPPAPQQQPTPQQAPEQSTAPPAQPEPGDTPTVETSVDQAVNQPAAVVPPAGTNTPATQQTNWTGSAGQRPGMQ